MHSPFPSPCFGAPFVCASILLLITFVLEFIKGQIVEAVNCCLIDHSQWILLGLDVGAYTNVYWDWLTGALSKRTSLFTVQNTNRPLMGHLRFCWWKCCAEKERRKQVTDWSPILTANDLTENALKWSNAASRSKRCEDSPLIDYINWIFPLLTRLRISVYGIILCVGVVQNYLKVKVLTWFDSFSANSS